MTTTTTPEAINLSFTRREYAVLQARIERLFHYLEAQRIHSRSDDDQWALMQAAHSLDIIERGRSRAGQ